MAFSAKQYLSIKQSNARLNIWEGSVRSGKTIASIIRWLDFVKAVPRDYPLMMAGKTNKTLERNIIGPIKQMVGPRRARYFSGKSELHLFNKVIDCVGAPDERAQERIRGSTIGGFYGDEISLWPESFFTMALSRLSLPGAKLFGTTNPDSPYHWLKTGYLDRRNELNMKVFHFILEDNINLSKEYVEELKKEYTGLWFKRFILGLWVLAEGVVYDMWNDDIHAIEPLVSGPEGNEKRFQRYFVAADYGTNNPTVFGLFGYDGSAPPVYLIKEYHYDSVKHGRQKTDREYADDLKVFLGGIRPTAIYVDPSAASFIAELRSPGRGFTVTEEKNSVLDGIRFVGSLISNNQFKVYRGQCPESLKEFSSYIWDAHSIKLGEDKPMKQFDHCMDMIRYGLFSHFFKQHQQRLIGFNYN